MRVDRVILTLTANPTYTGFWPYVAEIWAKKFKVQPTLMFYGSKEESLVFRGNGSTWGEQVLHIERIPSVTVNPSLDWACTWSLFYGATMFPDEVCMLAGIDQVPLNGLFFDQVKVIPYSKYTIGFADAYGNPRAANTVFPSSHHVALGSKFKEIFGIDNDWKTEVEKVFATRAKYPISRDFWGLDEAYSSDVLRQRIASGAGDVALVDMFWSQFQPNRLWRGKNALPSVDFDGIRQGRYTEWHADRPFESNSPKALAQLKESIPVYNW